MAAADTQEIEKWANDMDAAKNKDDKYHVFWRQREGLVGDREKAILLWILSCMMMLAWGEWSLVPSFACLATKQPGFKIICYFIMVAAAYFVFTAKLAIVRVVKTTYSWVDPTEDYSAQARRAGAVDDDPAAIDPKIYMNIIEVLEEPYTVPYLGWRIKVPFFGPMPNMHYLMMMSIPPFIEAMSTALAVPEVGKYWKDKHQEAYEASMVHLIPMLQYVASIQLPKVIITFLLGGVVLHALVFIYEFLQAKNNIALDRIPLAVYNIKEAAYQANLTVLANIFDKATKRHMQGATKKVCVKSSIGNPRLFSRIFVATGLKLWLKECLLMHTFQSLPGLAAANLVLAIVMGLVTMAQVLPSQYEAIKEWRQEVAKTDYFHNKHRRYYRSMLLKEAFLSALMTGLFLALIARLAGVWLCPTSVLNLAPPRCF